MTATLVRSPLTENAVQDGNCLRYLGSHDKDGYGKYSGRPAHRVVYEAEVGPIPEGMTLDHVFERGCRFRDCIAIAHLEPVTQAENKRRAAARKTHCKNDHPYTPENTYIHEGARYCRACNLAAVRRSTGRNL